MTTNMIPKDAREVYTNEKGKPIAYCPRDGIGITDLQRIEFYQPNKDRLAELQARARQRGESVAIAIDVDDPTWRQLVDLLMPGHDWQLIRDRGESPVARGVVPTDLITKVVAEVYPAAGEVTDGAIVVFAAGGALIVRG